MKKMFFAIILCVLSISQLQSQVTLEDCKQMARANYPTIKEFGMIEKIAIADISNIGKGYLPQIGASAQATWQNAVPAYPQEFADIFKNMGVNMGGINKDQYKIAIDLNQWIWDGGAISAQKDMARQQQQVSKAQLEVELYTLNQRVSNIYFGILLLEDNLRINDELSVVLKSNLNKMQALIDNGVAMQSNLNSIQVEILSNEQERMKITSSIKIYRNILSIYIAKDIQNETLMLPLTSIADISLNNRPELDLFHAQKEQAEKSLSLANSSLMPRIGIFAQGFYGNPGLNMFKDMVENKWSLNFLAGIKMQWSISGLYSNKNNSAKVNITKEMIDTHKEAFIFNNNIQATQQRTEITRIEHQIANDDEIIRLRQKIRMASEAKLANGIIDVNDLLHDITAENQSKIMRATRNIELVKTIYDLKYTLNQ